LSIPAKKKFSREPPTSGCNITKPPTCANAYIKHLTSITTNKKMQQKEPYFMPLKHMP
jgi:hypothetical protein